MDEAQTPLAVSVVIVSWNCAAALRRCLRELERSVEREKLEIIVVDDGSQDESPTLDTEFPVTTFLRLPRNFGYSKAANIGMRSAKAEFIFLLSPYVAVLPETVSALAAKLTEETEAVAVCPLLVSEEGQAVPQVAALPVSESIATAAWAGRFECRPAQPLDEERVAAPLASLSAFLARGYFLKGLRYIDERYGNSWVDAELGAQIRRAARKILVFAGIRAVAQPEPDLASTLSSSARALLSADWVLGAATYAGKHYGFTAGLKLRIIAVLRALGAALLSLLRFRDVGYQFSRLTYLVSGQKVDGTQTVL